MGLLSGLFKTKKKDVSMQPMLTNQQLEAQKALLDFGLTGKGPAGFQAGEGIDTSGFDFGLKDLERSGLSRIAGLLGSGTPEGIETARGGLSRLVDAPFDSETPFGGFSAFKRQLQREIDEADDVIDRESAITGSRFGSRILGEKGDLAEKQSDIIATTLADLFRQSQDRSLSAASSLANLEGLSEGIERGRVEDAFRFGGLERDLKNTKAQIDFNEKQRQRDEKLAALAGLETVFGRNVGFGLKDFTKKSPSTFQAILGETNPFIGSINTHKFGNVPNQASMADLVRLATSLSKGGVG